jgi:hypothetical protein
MPELRMPADLREAIVKHFSKSDDPMRLKYSDSAGLFLITVEKGNVFDFIERLDEDWLLQEPKRCPKCGR